MSVSSSRPLPRVAFFLCVSVVTLLAVPVRPAIADDRWAVGSGGWSSPGTWNGNTVPANTDTVHVGHVNGALTATVSLSQNVTANSVYVGYSGGSTGTLNLANSSLTANSLYVGYVGTGILTRETGTFAVGGVQVNNRSALTFAFGDTTGVLNLTGSSTVATTAAGNVNNNVGVNSGSTLTLGAALNVGVGGTVDVRDSGSTLNAQGNAITAGTLLLGWNSIGGGGTLANRGALTVSTLYVSGQNLNLTAADAVTVFHLAGGSTAFTSGASVSNLNLYSGATATTNAAGNIRSGVSLAFGSTLTLGAALNVGGGTIDVRDNGSTLNANNNAITAGSLSLGWSGGNTTLTNDGAVTVGNYYQANNTVLLRNGNDSLGSISLSGNAILQAASGQGTGLTLTGTATGALNIASGSKLRLELDGNYQGWILRWGGNHVADLNGLIADGRIDFVTTNAGTFSVGFQPDGFTYVFQPVPEPHHVLLAAVAGLGGFSWLRRRRVLATA